MWSGDLVDHFAGYGVAQGRTCGVALDLVDHPFAHAGKFGAL